MSGARAARGASSLDHVGLCAADGPALWGAYEALGFTLSPVNRQSGRRSPDAPLETFGTANRCAMLREGYVELLAIADPAGFDNGLTRFLARYTGLHILAFGVEDAAAELPRLRRAGLEVPGAMPLQRPVDDSGALARFSRLPLPDAPEGRIQLVQHHTPELMWQERWLSHANHAAGLESVILAVADPAATAVAFARLAGRPLVPDPAGGYALPLPQGQVRILPPEAVAALLPDVVVPTLPFQAACTLRTDDGNAAIGRIAGRVLRELPAGDLMVPPEHAGGAALVFRA